jgi:LacI family transcriptional regulator
MKTVVTLADVARESGVSLQTVSRALNNKGEISPETRRRIVAIAERLGYRRNGIARGLVTNRTMTLGLVIPDIANPFFPEIARGAETVALAHGYNIFLCNTMEDPDREELVLGQLEEKRVDGVILCSTRLPDDRLFPLLHRQPAVVLINHPTSADKAAIVRVDDAAGTRQAVRHLQATHRTPLAFLAGPPHSHSSQARTQAFVATLSKTTSVKTFPLVHHCPPDVQGGYQHAMTLLREHRELRGLLCYNDLVAIGALQACAELGLRVPEDLAIVGCDDILLAGLVTPPLTTLRVSKPDIGASALHCLLHRIAGDVDQEEIVFTPELLVRVSAP